LFEDVGCTRCTICCFCFLFVPGDGSNVVDDWTGTGRNECVFAKMGDISEEDVAQRDFS